MMLISSTLYLPEALSQSVNGLTLLEGDLEGLAEDAQGCGEGYLRR